VVLVIQTATGKEGYTVDRSDIAPGSIAVIGDWGTDVWRAGEYTVVGETPGKLATPELVAQLSPGTQEYQIAALAAQTLLSEQETAQRSAEFGAILERQVECL